jgi:hypothetical protein
MLEVLEALERLSGAVAPVPPSPETVAGDLARGHRALTRRRRRRACSAASAVVIAAVALVTVNASQAGHIAPPASAGSRAAQASGARLVAYTGAQPAGFRVSTVPAGWQVVSSDPAAFVLAPPGASTAEPTGNGSVISFVGRLAVMLQGMSRLPADEPVTNVTINGRPAQLGAYDESGPNRALWLIFTDTAGHKILVQVPASLHLSTDQIIRFAQGITATSQARPIAG